MIKLKIVCNTPIHYDFHAWLFFTESEHNYWLITKFLYIFYCKVDFEIHWTNYYKFHRNICWLMIKINRYLLKFPPCNQHFYDARAWGKHWQLISAHWFLKGSQSVKFSPAVRHQRHIDVSYPESKVHGASMRPILGRQDPGGPHVGPMNFAIWVVNHLMLL